MRTKAEIIADMDVNDWKFEDHGDCSELAFCNRCSEAAAIHYALEDELDMLEDNS